LEQLPSLPVGLFKTHALKSVPTAEVYKILTSSGTTDSRPSRITLDRATSGRQLKALARIMTSELGPQRRPMLIVDSEEEPKDRSSFSARSAGVIGLSTFGRDHHFALRPDLSLDEAGLRLWLDRHASEPLLVFGFTFLVWRFALAAAGKGFDLSRAMLLHGGGWKKLEGEAVSRQRFKEALREAAGIKQVRDYYGMIEQVGSIFLECEQGFFHTPIFADVIVRDPQSWRPAAPGVTGVMEVLSLLPTSYPGHCLLTEDLGAWMGIDDCPCGRLGKTFTISGRVPKAEPRGCSDTRLVPEAA
jgi:hypothetical protein